MDELLFDEYANHEDILELLESCTSVNLQFSMSARNHFGISGTGIND